MAIPPLTIVSVDGNREPCFVIEEITKSHYNCVYIRDGKLYTRLTHRASISGLQEDINYVSFPNQNKKFIEEYLISGDQLYANISYDGALQKNRSNIPIKLFAHNEFIFSTIDFKGVQRADCVYLSRASITGPNGYVLDRDIIAVIDNPCMHRTVLNFRNELMQWTYFAFVFKYRDPLTANDWLAQCEEKIKKSIISSIMGNVLRHKQQ